MRSTSTPTGRSCATASRPNISDTAALRRSVKAWSELVWNTTLTEVISEETSQVRHLLPTPDELPEEQALGLPGTVMRPVRGLNLPRRPEPQV